LRTADLPLYAEEGGEKQEGVYPPASCGFYALYDGKAVYFITKSCITSVVQLFFCYTHIKQKEASNGHLFLG